MTDRQKSPKTQAEWFGEQAYAAWQEGQSALHDGRIDAARRWLERARRLAPADATIGLSLAVARLHGREDASNLFNEIAARHDLRDAWFGLATARAVAHEWSAAASALATGLSRHVIPEPAEIADLATLVVTGVGAAGWCCQTGGGQLEVRPARSDARCVASLDGLVLGAMPTEMPPSGASLAIVCDGEHLLGSPLALGRMRALDGFVETSGGGVAGWAWHPSDPGTDPVILVRAARTGAMLRLRATDTDMPTDRPLARPRRFAVPAASIAGWSGPLHVTGLDGRHLPGSPLDPSEETLAAFAIASATAAHLSVGNRAAKGLRLDAGWLAVPADILGPPATAVPDPTRPLAVVVPAYRDLRLTLTCLAAARRTMPDGTALIVVDDATPEPELARALDRLAASGDITLIRHTENRGFPAAANTGMRAAFALPGARDIVLLNSDAILTRDALAALRAIVHGAADIGTATPLSNDATICSYPDRAGENDLPEGPDLARLARLAARANAGVTVEVPTAVGFCMYIRRECLAATGAFREATFAQGYGEENDFCIRARHLGWRHVAAPGVFVAHAGGGSFKQGALGAARQELIARNLRTLERLHPGYHDLVAAFHDADPLAPARRRLDAARFAARRSRRPASVILITHDSGGGVERVVRARCEALRQDGVRPIVLRPIRDPDATSTDAKLHLRNRCFVFDGVGRETPNMRFAIPDELDLLADLLRSERPQSVEIHHLLGHAPEIRTLASRLGVPWDIHVHDYACLCPRITLIGPERRYCGEPIDPAVCEACIADAGRNDEEDIAVAALRVRSADDLGGARFVTVPSADVAARLRRHFPGLTTVRRPLEDDADLPSARALPPVDGGRVRRVAVIGAVGIEKGYDVLLACARDAAARALPLEFVVVGHTKDDRRLTATGRVFVTGPYREADALQEIAAQSPDLAFLPSIWPETWCFVVGHAWRAGLHVATFDIGAPAERIRRNGRGWLLPLGLSATSVNNALLAAEVPSGDDMMRTE